MAARKKAIDKVVAAHKKRRRSLDVPEWDMTLYFGPLVMADMQAVADRMKRSDGVEDPTKSEQDRRIYLLIEKAELKDGSRAFEYGDRMTLKSKADYSVISKVIGFMYQASMDAGTVDDAKKNSSETPGSDGDSA